MQILNCRDVRLRRLLSHRCLGGIDRVVEVALAVVGADEGIHLGWAVRGDRLGGSVRRDRDQHPGLVGSDALKKVGGLGFAHIRSPPYRFTTRWRIHLSTASMSLYSILLTTVALGKSSAGSRFHRQRVMPVMFRYLASVPL